MEKALKDFTKDELIDELRRREIVDATPNKVETPDWSRVELLCEEFVSNCISERRKPEDTPIYIFEASMRAVYGSTIWDYLNSIN